MSQLTSEGVAGGMTRLSMHHYRRILIALLLFFATVAPRAPFCGQTIWNVDEGITVTAAQSILSGGVLYRDIADQRSPLVPYLESIILAVGGAWNNAAIHWTLAVLLGLAALGLWRIAARLGHERVGVAAALVFAVLCFQLPEGYDAMAAHTEWFLLLFSVTGFLAFAVALGRPGLRWGLCVGALFGLATLCKQPGILDWGTTLVLLGLLAISAPVARRSALLRLGIGSAIGLGAVLGLALGYFAWHGALADLRYYAWTYNNTVYVPALSLGQRLASVRVPFVLAAQFVPAALVLGIGGAIALLIVAFRGLGRRPVEISPLPWLALGWTASGLVATTLSGRGFSHYSIQVIPGLSLVCGWLLVAGWDGWCRVDGPGGMPPEQSRSSSVWTRAIGSASGLRICTLAMASGTNLSRWCVAQRHRTIGCSSGGLRRTAISTFSGCRRVVSSTLHF
jgi:hypothetical protein